MRLARLALLVALLSVPLAAAGSEDDPEVRSPRDRDEPAGDLLAVWLEDDPRGVMVTFQSAALSADESRLVYSLSVDVDGARVAPAVGYDGVGRLQTDSGANPSGWRNGRLDNALRIERVTRGEPGEISVVIPWGVYGLQEGSEITPRSATSALCCDPRSERWISPYDEAPARRPPTYVVTDAGIAQVDRSLFPILVPAWVIPTIVVGCVAGGMGGGLVLAHATRRAPAPPSALAAPARPPVPPPGKRFRREPPMRHR